MLQSHLAPESEGAKGSQSAIYSQPEGGQSVCSSGCPLGKVDALRLAGGPGAPRPRGHHRGCGGGQCQQAGQARSFCFEWDCLGPGVPCRRQPLLSDALSLPPRLEAQPPPCPGGAPGSAGAPPVADGGPPLCSTLRPKASPLHAVQRGSGAGLPLGDSESAPAQNRGPQSPRGARASLSPKPGAPWGPWKGLGEFGQSGLALSGGARGWQKPGKPGEQQDAGGGLLSQRTAAPACTSQAQAHRLP